MGSPTREIKECLSMTQPTLPTYLARDLMQDGDISQIILGDQTYTLRVTRAGKLILTK
jgi:hemin uptake protein HemP